MKKKIMFFGVFLLMVIGCKKEEKEIVQINPEDYIGYLYTDKQTSFNEAWSLRNFWSKRLKIDTSGIGDIAPLAGAYEQLFATTGKVQYLLDAEKLYAKGMQISAGNKDAFARGLAHNYISQHRFKEAYQLLQETYNGESNKHQTRLLLFDAAMEVGDYDNAYQYLNEIKKVGGYHYSIRASKWSDYRGDLDEAIILLEQAKDIAESRDSKSLKIWTYTNLGDYYGHAGRVSDAYYMYLETLKLQPDNAYAKKGIAWILYAGNGNTKEAHRILDSISKNHNSPDYLLLRAELHEYEKDIQKSQELKAQFIKEVQLEVYGNMYTTHLIEFFSDKEPAKALLMAQKELENRATPETYHLLALSQLENGDLKEALQTIENHVSGKTSEPMTLYHSALVYKANGQKKKVKSIKEELAQAAFELGPVLMKKIKML